MKTTNRRRPQHESLWIEPLEARRLCSTSIAQPESSTHTPIAHVASFVYALPAGRYKGSTVSTSKGFTTRLTITLGKMRSNGTVIGIFTYLNSFAFTVHLRLNTLSTFHATIATGSLTGTLTGGKITAERHDTVIALSGHYQLAAGTNSSDSGTFLVHN